MPTGRVRWFDAAKGYGFITSEEGKDVFLPAQALPTGVTTLRKGAKVEYSVVDGRRGPQAMDVRLIASAPSSVSYTHLDVYKRQVRSLPDGEGFNAATDTYEDLLAAGVTDPVKVTRSALQLSLIHIDVYKRQSLIRRAYSSSASILR